MKNNWLKLCACTAIMSGIYMQSFSQDVYNSTGRKGNPTYRKNSEIKGFDVNKVVLGSWFDLMLRGNYFTAGVSPTVGYKFTDWFSAGIAGRFHYVNFKDQYRFIDPNSGNMIFKPARMKFFGPSVWTRFSLMNYFVHAEYEYNYNIQTYFQHHPTTIYEKMNDKYFTSSLLLGGGYKNFITDRISGTVTILYDVLQDSKNNMRVDPLNPALRYSLSPYSGQIILRMGLIYNF